MRKRKAEPNGRPEYLVLIKQWIHQGFTYLDRTEKIYRITSELLLFLVIFLVLKACTNTGAMYLIIFSFMISHTINWVFNYNFWTCMVFTFPSVKNPGHDKTIRYLQKMQLRMMKYNSVGGCMIYGSVSRNKWHTRSDLDIRILRQPGFINGLRGYLVVFSERLIAVFARQPLDLYMADTIGFLSKMRSDEYPVFLKNADSRLWSEYNKKTITNFKNLRSLNQAAKNESTEFTLGV